MGLNCGSEQKRSQPPGQTNDLTPMGWENHTNQSGLGLTRSEKGGIRACTDTTSRVYSRPVMDLETVLRCPLLGALYARPPEGLVPRAPTLREPGKRVRWHIGVLLRSRQKGMRMAELSSVTGFSVREINSALGRMRQADEVEALGEPGDYVYRWVKNA